MIQGNESGVAAIKGVPGTTGEKVIEVLGVLFVVAQDREDWDAGNGFSKRRKELLFPLLVHGTI